MENKTEILLTNVAENREAWIQARSKRLGASDMAAICGLNRYRTPLDVWLEKTGKRAPEPENDAMWLGTELEPVVGKLYQRKTGRQIRPFKDALSHKDYPWAIATPDFVIDFDEGHDPHRALLETKTTTVSSDWEDDNIPNYAHIQNMFQMGIGGFSQGAVACLVLPTRGFVHKDIEFSPEIFSQLIEKGEEFMEFVKKDIPPAAQTKEDFLTMLDQKLMTIKENSVIVIDDSKNDDLVILATEWCQLNEKRLAREREAKELKEKSESIQLDLRRVMKDNGMARLGQFVLHQKERGRKGYAVGPAKWVEFKIVSPE